MTSGRPEDMVTVGEVLRAHGLRGEVVVELATDNPARFAAGSRLHASVEGRPRRLEVASSRNHHGRVLVRFVELPDRTGAETLRGATLSVPVSEVPPAEDGACYHFELVGCRVVDRRLGDLGLVTEVVEDGGGVLLAVASGPSGERRSLLVPFVRALLPEIDVPEGLIRSDLPEGLVEACALTS